MSLLVATAAALRGRIAAFDLRLERGTLTLLVGPNGAGKTSLLHALARIGRTSGSVRVDGRDLSGLGPVARSRLLFFSPATRDLRWPLAGRDLVALGLPRAHVEAALDAVVAGDLADRPVDRLSTGERARLLLARALASQAEVLLLDEPAANLDPLWQLRTLALLRAEAERGAAVLASIHDLALVETHADRLIVVDGGRIVADGERLEPELLGSVFGIARTASGWEAVA